MRRAWGTLVYVACLASCGSVGDAPDGPCTPTHQGIEVCDGKDNDCNGFKDDNAECPKGSVCSHGACTCTATVCGNPPECADLSADPKHCGSCDVACKPGESCVASTCTCLPPKAIVCGGQCLNLMTDEKNCGSCGHECTQTGAICSNGKCTCAPGMILCGDACVDPMTSRTNCGTCFRTCPVACSNSICVVANEVTAGGTHSCARLSDGGEVRCWGSADSYELGDGQVVDQIYPKAIGLMGASTVSAGGHHTCVIAGGTVSCFGANTFGQIGDGTFKPAKKATPVVGMSDAAEIALGDTHSCARRSSGAVVCWGSNGFGELGDGTQMAKNTPVGAVGISDATAIAVGAHHSCALRKNRTVWCWGSNQQGELGDGTTTNRSTPVQVSVANVAMIRAGGAHTCALDDSSKLWCWGTSDNQELVTQQGPVTTPQVVDPNATDVALGAGHRCTQHASSIACVGHPIASGVITSFSSAEAGDLHTCALRNGEVGCFGADSRGQCSNGWIQTPPITIVEF